MGSGWSRRAFLQRTGAVAGAVVIGGGAADLLAACGGSSPSPASSGSSGAGTGSLEIFSWWTGPGEKDGLKMLEDLYSKKYPNVKIVDAAVAGGAGSAAKAVLNSRMQANNPPDSFQVHAGQELISTWVKAGKMETLTSFWKDQSLDSVMPKDLKDIVTSNGDVWSIPVDIHRGNCLWYNLKTLGSATPPTTYDEFFKSLDQFKTSGIQYPLALGSKGNWQVAMLFENGILANGGADYYKTLFQGKGNFTDTKVKDTLTQMARLLNYVNPDHTTRDWDDAAALVVQGKAVYTIMGDWAKGYFTSQTPPLVPNKDFGVVASPGTAGSYVIVCDTFGLPKGAKDRANALAWLQVLGSKEGQAEFNPKKGSIPARTDVPKDGFDPIAQAFMDEFKKSKLVPSSAHGSAAPDSFVTAVNGIMGQFVQNKDVNKTASDLQAQAQQLLTS